MSNDGIEIVETTETVQVEQRERTPANQQKVEILQDFLSILPNEEVDRFFLLILHEAEELSYNLKDTPEALLAAIDG
jgi:hypothetical protein